MTETPSSAGSPPQQGATLRLALLPDANGPSRCLSMFASSDILPKKFSYQKSDKGVIEVEIAFEAHEDKTRIKRALVKLSTLPCFVAVLDENL